MTVAELVVSEIFGPTLQGEGPTAGTPTMFLRLGRCNLSCSWCDTPYTWDWHGKNGQQYDAAAELCRMSVDVVAEKVATAEAHVVVTGGEPLLQADGLVALDDLLIGRAVMECETNGTKPPPAALVAWRWNVSPKLSNSGDEHHRRIVPEVLETFVEWQRRRADVCFKFVVGSTADLDEVDALAAAYRMQNVWLMPEGRSADAIVDRLSWLVPAAVERGYRVTPRLHVLAYGDRRAV